MKIATWNMQGGSLPNNDVKQTVLLGMFNRDIEVVCLQEMTEPLPIFRFRYTSADGVEVYTMNSPNSGRVSNAVLYNCYYFQWSHSGNKRCSLAIYAMPHVSAYGAILDASPGNRPMLWVKIGDTFIGNVHLPSGHSPSAEASFRHFQSKMAGMAPPGHRYAIAGDFNMPLDYIKGHFPDESNFHNPQVATHQSGNTLDYIYSREYVDGMSYTLGYYSDHRPFECTIL